MAKVYHIFGGISEHELESILDKSGFLTIKGKKLLARMGVQTGIKVSIGKTTIQNLVNLYKAWKTPDHPIAPEIELLVGKLAVPEDDIFIWNKVEELKETYRMGIKIGEFSKIGEEVMIGLGVSIGRYCEVSERCELDLFATILDRVFLGKAVFIGKDSDVESGSRLMDRVVVAPRTVVKENSFIPEVFVFNENKKYQ
jgi:NDP-sugar pyrophosphorylase family protein